MRVLIIEDEKPAADRLKKMLEASLPEATILDVLDSVEDAVSWYKNFPHPDLSFVDIQLADGLSFEIFQQIHVTKPLIFTTAFDQYAIKAFKLNSIDYLLKPIDPAELDGALNKFRELHQAKQSPESKGQDITQLLLKFQQLTVGAAASKYKSRFLVKSGSQFHHVPVEQIAYFVSEDGATCLLAGDGSKFIIDDKMEDVEEMVSPSAFFRVNRKFLVSVAAISKIHSFSNSRLKLDLSPDSKADVIVAREKVASFKSWLNT